MGVVRRNGRGLSIGLGCSAKLDVGLPNDYHNSTGTGLGHGRGRGRGRGKGNGLIIGLFPGRGNGNGLIIGRDKRRARRNLLTL